MRYSARAEAIIDRHTFGRAKKMSDVPYAVLLCCFELIDVCRAEDEASKGKAVSSENVGDWSRSYSSVSAAEYEQTEKSLLLTYLSGVCDDNGVPLLYRGVAE